MVAMAAASVTVGQYGFAIHNHQLTSSKGAGEVKTVLREHQFTSFHPYEGATIIQEIFIYCKKGGAMYEKYAALRDAKGVNDAQVARATGIATATFSAWKKGTYKPKLEKLMKIAAFFEVSIEDLLEE